MSLSTAPKKRHFRSRAHCNPLSHNDSFVYPNSPAEFSSTLLELYPVPIHDSDCDSNDNDNESANATVENTSKRVKREAANEEKRMVRFLDIGMGFGGMTVALAETFPSKLVMGMEIRPKVCEYVRLRIEALRAENVNNEVNFNNAACLRTNCMRYLPNYFEKGQLEKIFVCFPDPHFKTKNHRRRIISFNMLSEYAFLLKPDGKLYTVTDVKELHDWHVEKCSAHPCFERVTEENSISSLSDDPCTRLLFEATEEGKKVARIGGQKFSAVFRRRHEHELPTPNIASLFGNNQEMAKKNE